MGLKHIVEKKKKNRIYLLFNIQVLGLKHIVDLKNKNEAYRRFWKIKKCIAEIQISRRLREQNYSISQIKVKKMKQIAD